MSDRPVTPPRAGVKVVSRAPAPDDAPAHGGPRLEPVAVDDATRDPDAEHALLAVLRCPICQATRFELTHGSALCQACGRSFVYRERMLDLVGDRLAPPNPAQRLMQAGFYSSIYERWSRPAFTRAMAGRELELELGLAVDLLTLHELDTAPRVLDIACGPGLFARRFAAAMSDDLLDAPPGGVVVGVDLSRTMLREAARTAHAASVDNLYFVRGDALALPFREASFDRTHCAAALHLIDDPRRALAEMRRVLKPGGIAVVSTFLSSQVPAVHAAQRLAGKLTGMRLFDPDQLDKIVARAGMRIVGRTRERYAVSLRLARAD